MNSSYSRDRNHAMRAFGLAVAVFSLGAIAFFALPSLLSVSYDGEVGASNLPVGKESQEETVRVTHLPTPEPVKAIYMTSCAAGTPTLRSHLVSLIEETELNSIVIDIKDYTGKLSFTPDDPSLSFAVSEQCGAIDMKEFVRTLHEKNIYIIGRVTVFQDPFLSVRRPELAVERLSDGGLWRDKKGISYLDPASQEVWDYVIAIARASYAIGFDEINFDYIRFPSDGNLADISYSASAGRKKADVLEDFFRYLHEKLKGSNIITSADLFGMTMTNIDDLNIGQVLERALPYFDYIAPMVYPSHYPPMFNGWANPNENPYRLIAYVMKRGVLRAVATSTTIKTFEARQISTTTPILFEKPAWSKLKLRPWLQDFDYGGNYGTEEVRGQIQATYDAGLTSWMLWDPSNRYTSEALLTE